MYIYDPPYLPPNEMWVGLRILDAPNFNASTARGKEIIAWNLCNGKVTSALQQQKNKPPQ